MPPHIPMEIVNPDKKAILFFPKYFEIKIMTLSKQNPPQIPDIPLHMQAITKSSETDKTPEDIA